MKLLNAVRPLQVRCNDGVMLVGDIRGPAEGPVIVLLHGAGQTRHAWSRSAKRLSHFGYRCITYDARGHGESDWSSDGDYSSARLARDIRSVAAGVSGSPILIGASMGGAASMQLIGEGFPAAALILVDIVPHADRSGFIRIKRFMQANPEGFRNLEDAVAAVAAYSPDRTHRSNPEGLMRNLRRSPDGRLRWHWDPRIVQREIDVEAAELDGLLASVASRPDVPLLVVRGLTSDVVPADAAQRFRRAVPWARLAEVKAGHMVAGDRNDAFTEAILNFLASDLSCTPA